jgi:hypothetical protein
MIYIWSIYIYLKYFFIEDSDFRNKISHDMVVNYKF